MRKRIFMLLMVISCLAVSATEKPKYLVVWAKDGAKTTYALKDNPQVTFNEDAMLVTKDGQETFFPMGDVQRFTYESIMLGDVNGDAKVDIVDVAKTINYLLTFTRSDFPEQAADINKDGTVDSDDVTAMIELVVNGPETAASVSGQEPAGEAFYVYRNDDQISGFLRDEVESIVYSNYDADNNFHDEIVSQIVTLSDTVFCTPLSAIDSVGFVTPETVYQADVINIADKLMPYVESSDSMTIILSPSTPVEIIPKVGNKLVTLEMNEKFPVGFAGEVVSVDEYQVECKLVTLDEVFETLYSVTSTYGYQDGTESRMSNVPKRAIDAHGDINFKLGTFTWSQSTELSHNILGNDDLAIKGGTQLSIGITPSFHVMSTLIINREEGTYFNACIIGDITLQESLGVYGGIEWSHDFLDREWVRTPVAPLTYFYVKPGLFLRASATASLSAVLTQQFATAAAFDYSSRGRNMLKPTCGGRLVSNSFDIEGAVDGTLATGGFVEIGLSVLSSDIDNLCFRGELGAELVGHAVLYNSDIAEASRETKVYERFKNSSIAANVFVSTAVQAKLGTWGVSTSLPLNLNYNLRTWNVVPTFSNTTFKQSLSPSTSADASVDMSGDCLFPVMVGLSVRDENGEEVDGCYANAKFDNGNKQYTHTFTNLPMSEELTLYPKVRIFGYEMLASPSSDMEETAFPVEITDFKVTKSQYDKGAFTNDGQQYDYRFNASVTVTLDDEEGIADWGYVYLDPNGREALISLKQFGTSYTDTRYAYFRNEAKSTCTLYGYVIYTDSNEPVYGEPHDYPLEYGETSCPDANHPHMIDLGLPSGTKWACCNVGASTPEGYGGYYAWGETTTKSVYNWDTYQYGSSWDNVVNIGSDIAGTQYDAATANWGAPWRMPSLAQVQELLDNTTSVWTTQNGVNGRKFTGSNGGTIFLPAAGYRWPGELYFAGGWGYYWSSTLDESSPYYAYVLNFYSASAYWNGYYRLHGHVVRPVR